MMDAAAPAGAGLEVHLATAPGAAGIAIVEIYGPGAEGAMRRHFRPRGGRLPRPGEARLGVLADARGDPVDDVLVAPQDSGSWCGRPLWTVTCHGGAVVTERVIGVFTAAGAVRRSTAEVLEGAAGEGWIDPIRARAFALLIGSLTERAAGYFLRQYNGELGRRLAAAARGLESGALSAEAAASELDRMAAGAAAAVRLGEPIRILLAGRTNAGKSTLFNALLGRERVVVSPRPGTTRDLIEETIEIAGYPVTLIDSAGLRPGEAADAVEREGARRALEAPRDAVLFLSDRDVPPGPEEEEYLARTPSRRFLRVRTKLDLIPPAARGIPGAGGAADGMAVSAVTGEGLEALREAIRAAWLGPPEGIEIPPLPFTKDLVALVERARDLCRRTGAELDALGKALIECFGLKIGRREEKRRESTAETQSTQRRAQRVKWTHLESGGFEG